MRIRTGAQVASFAVVIGRQERPGLDDARLGLFQLDFKGVSLSYCPSSMNSLDSMAFTGFSYFFSWNFVGIVGYNK